MFITPSPSSSARHRRGFSLLEVIMATGLFVIAGVSLMAALNEIALASTESVDDGRVTEQLRSLLTEVSHQPDFGPMDSTLVPDRRGISYHILVEPAEFTTAKGEPLRNVYQIRVTASRKLSNGDTEMIDEAETLRFDPGNQAIP